MENNHIFEDVAANAIVRLLQTERHYFRYHIKDSEKVVVIRKCSTKKGVCEIGYYNRSDVEIISDEQFTTGNRQLREQITSKDLKAGAFYFLELVGKYD